MAIDDAEVRKIADLARLELDDEAIETLRRQLGSILDHVAMLDELDVSSVAPTSGIVADTELREDEESSSLTTDEALRNAPDSGAGHFRVPRVIGE